MLKVVKNCKSQNDNSKNEFYLRYINCEKLDHILSSNSYDSINTVLCDLRESRCFTAQHIKGALLMNCTKKLVMKKTIMEMKRLIQSHDDKLKLICYNDDGKYSDEVIKSLQELSTNTIYFLKGGIQEFVTNCSEDLLDQGSSIQSLNVNSPSNPNFHSEDILNHNISEIVTNLYIGNESDSQDSDLLNHLKITHILCVNSRSPMLFPHIEYMKINALDCIDQDLMKYFPDAIDFIDTALSNDGRVLVHCMAGVSRSVTIVMAYLIHNNFRETKKPQSVLEILEYVRSKRSIASPNFNFLGQLERYNRRLY